MENEVQDILIGTVEDISFYNDTTGFCVAEVNTGEEGVTVVGTVGELAIGAEIECEACGLFTRLSADNLRLKRLFKLFLRMQAEY